MDPKSKQNMAYSQAVMRAAPNPITANIGEFLMGKGGTWHPYARKISKFLGFSFEELGQNLYAKGMGRKLTREENERAFGAMAGIIGGPISRMAPKTALVRAKNMLMRRVPSNEIYRETGWYKDIDGGWKYEISDEASQLKKYGDVESFYNTQAEMAKHNLHKDYTLGEVM